MNQIISKICADVVNEYKKDKNVLGIALFGSVASNKFDQYSDIDIYILLNEKSNFSRINFRENNIRVDIILNTLSEARTYLKEERYNVRRNTSHMLSHAKVLHQRGDDLGKMIIEAKSTMALPVQYSDDEIVMHKYSIDDFWDEVQRAIKKQDSIAFGFTSQLLLNNIMELFLKLHGEYLRQPNEMFTVLSTFDKKLAEKINQFYQASNIKIKESILAELVAYTYNQSNGPLPDKWTIK